MKNDFKTIVTPLAAFFLAALLFAACGQSSPPSSGAGTTPPAKAPTSAAATAKWDETLAAAKKEGSVTVYASDSGPSIKDIVAPAFKDKFGITIDVLTARADELAQKIQTERQRGLYLPDVHITGNSMLTNYKPNGLVDPLQSALILPEATDPSAWPKNTLPWVDRDKFCIDLTGAYFSYILINTDLVKPGDLKSYKDLLQPRWQGKIIMMDPTVPGGAVNWMMFILRMALPQDGEQFLQQLAQPDLMLTRDPRLTAEWASRGKYSIAIAPGTGAVTPLFRAGAPISWTRMEEGGLVHPSSSVLGLANQAPHPNAARVLVNWLLTAEGQRLFSQGFGQPAMRLGVSTEGIDPFTVVKPGEKVFYADEDFFIEVQTAGPKIGQKLFGHLLK